MSNGHASLLSTNSQPARKVASTVSLYNWIYANSASNSRTITQRAEVSALLRQLGVSKSALVVEVGAGFGELHDIHPGYLGIEQSNEGVKRGQQELGAGAKLQQGDVTMLPLANSSVDFLFSYATLEHVPQINAAFAEIVRVLKPGGYAWLSPAWNCRSWTVAKLEQRPYSDLTMSQKLGKILIPMRENLIVRLLQSLPGRLSRELRVALGLTVSLDYQPLQPDFALIEKYGHVSDDDAFVSMDAHAALAWFAGQSFQLISHPTFRKRLLIRGTGILVRKPN